MTRTVDYNIAEKAIGRNQNREQIVENAQPNRAENSIETELKSSWTTNKTPANCSFRNLHISNQ
jgi:hypothetical protein